MLKSSHLTEVHYATDCVANQFIATLPATDFETLSGHFSAVELKRHAIIHDTDRPIEAVYFLESGALSRVTRTPRGSSTEVAMIGRTGFVGLSAVLGSANAMHRSMVSLPGVALRIPAKDLSRAISTSPSIREHLLRYVRILIAVKSVVSLCNARHSLEARLTRWLLLAHDFSNSDVLPITHAQPAMMLGVRRSSVSDAIKKLECKGAVLRGRGDLTIRNRPALEKGACECYQLIRERSILSGVERSRYMLSCS
jgi:CRP-like cAMP-binding protein